MKPAVTRGLWMATAAAGAILVTGLAVGAPSELESAQEFN